MAVLNVTLDSFYDGGRYQGDAVFRRIDECFDEGAFVVDIGAESTRPGAVMVPANEQLTHLLPAVRYAVASGRGWVSVDTNEPSVAEAVLTAGAHVINDVSCLRHRELAEVTQRFGAALILMHARGFMTDMSGFSQYPDDGYGDVVSDVLREWCDARDHAVGLGMAQEDILFDPGFGFAKNAKQSMLVLERLRQCAVLGTPIVVGLSRKSFLNLIEHCPPEDRLGATVSACLLAAEQGAMLVRVHDVQVVRQALAAKRFFERAFVSQVELEASCSTVS